MKADAIVDMLLESDDPKDFALEMTGGPDAGIAIVQNASNAILATPWQSPENDVLPEFYRQIDRIVAKMCADLEELYHVKMLDGLGSLMRASMPKPWNYDSNYKMSRKNAREIVSCFKANSKKIR